LVGGRILKELLEQIKEENPEAMLVDGFDEAILGTCRRFGQQTTVAYDYNKVIEILMKDGMTFEEAEEYFEFNIIGAWVGDGTPVFIELPA
jgi:hypothetical protein